MLCDGACTAKGKANDHAQEKLEKTLLRATPINVKEQRPDDHARASESPRVPTQEETELRFEQAGAQWGTPWASSSVRSQCVHMDEQSPRTPAGRQGGVSVGLLAA